MKKVEEINKHNTVCMMACSCRGQGKLCSCSLGSQREVSVQERRCSPTALGCCCSSPLAEEGKGQFLTDLWDRGLCSSLTQPRLYSVKDADSL